jgi:hypothetical protein
MLTDQLKLERDLHATYCIYVQNKESSKNAKFINTINRIEKLTT